MIFIIIYFVLGLLVLKAVKKTATYGVSHFQEMAVVMLYPIFLVLALVLFINQRIKKTV